jgi:ceramide glucosyltransferase
MHPIVGLVLACATIATLFQVAPVVLGWRFFRRAWRTPPPGRPLPGAGGVTVLKPLKGRGLDLYANLASFCRQDYAGPVQIVFGVTDPSDPAVPIVQRVKRDFPERVIVLAVGEAPGFNRKVANLRQMLRHARHPILVLSDGDVRVGPDYLTAMVAPLADRSVGLTTCLYRGRYSGLPSLLEALSINTDLVPQVLTTTAVRLRWAYGASIAVRREALDSIGGFAAIADHLADDNQLGRLVDRAGWNLVLVPYVVDTVLDSETLRGFWRHQLRWARTYRVCQPLGWFASIITHATTWGLAALVATGGAPLGWAVCAAAIGIRLATLRAVMALMDERDVPRHLWLVPAKDLLATAVWAMSFLGRTVVWSGKTFRVARDGRMLPVHPEPEVETLHTATPRRFHAAGR